MKRTLILVVLLSLCVAPLFGAPARPANSQTSLTFWETVRIQAAIGLHMGSFPSPRSLPGSKFSMMMPSDGDGGGGGWQCLNGSPVKTGCRVGIDPGCYSTEHEVAIRGCGSQYQ